MIASEEVQMVKDAVAGYLGTHYDFAARTATSRSDTGLREDIWRGLTQDLGLAGMALDDGGDLTAQQVVAEELGRALVIEPLIETCFLAAPLLQQCGGAEADALAQRIATGDARVALAIEEPEMRSDLSDIALTARLEGGQWHLNGTKSVVMTAPWADTIIVAARTAGTIGDTQGLSLFLVPSDTPGLAVFAYPTLDGRRAADLIFTDAALSASALIGTQDTAIEHIEWLRDRAITLQAAEATGLLEKLLSDTVAYCQQRQQFGQPLSGFQVLQHRMVNMYLQVEMTRSAAQLAAASAHAPPTDRAKAASTAKVTTANACRYVGQNAVQLHGGMGMTDELAIGHYFKRATVIEAEHGSADWHLQRHAALSR